MPHHHIVMCRFVTLLCDALIPNNVTAAHILLCYCGTVGTYFAMISNKVDLYSIMAIGNPIEMDDYGTQLKKEFNHIPERVPKTYGEPLVVDTLDPNSMWSDDRYWSMAFKEDARNLGACWPRSAEDKLPDGISKIWLTTSSIRYKEAKVGLVYEFTNAIGIQDEEDDVF